MHSQHIGLALTAAISTADQLEGDYFDWTYCIGATIQSNSWGSATSSYPGFYSRDYTNVSQRLISREAIWIPVTTV